jgi:hypothetical protein
MKMFAFWRYDQFPYILGAEVVKMRDNGMVETTGYQGFLFKPIKILPRKAGEALHEKLKALTSEHRAAMDKLNEDFRAKVREVFGEGAR